MDISSELRGYKTKIKAVDSTRGEKFEELVGIKLHGLIKDHPALNATVDERVHYFERLAADKSFADLQDRLYELIREILAKTDIEEVRRVQSKWIDQGICNPLRGDKGILPLEEIFKTLPELHQIYSEKKNYYRLGDIDVGSQHDYKMYHYLNPQTGDLLKQYDVFEKYFLDTMKNISSSFRKRLEEEDLVELNGEYEKARYKFDQQIRERPVRLHVSDFQLFYYYLITVSPKPGEKDLHKNLYFTLREDNNRDNFVGIKESSLTVIDDLLEVLSKEVADTSTVFTLAKNGELSRRITEGVETYTMEKDGLRYKVLRELNRGSRDSYHETDGLAETLNVTPAEVRKAITDIKAQIKKNFHGLEAKDFIDGKRKSGYRLASAVRIVEK